MGIVNMENIDLLYKMDADTLERFICKLCKISYIEGHNEEYFSARLLLHEKLEELSNGKNR